MGYRVEVFIQKKEGKAAVWELIVRGWQLSNCPLPIAHHLRRRRNDKIL